MATRTESQSRELWDTLSPYELAVLAFTSPDLSGEVATVAGVLTLTTKDSFLWAGAIAHAIIRRPELTVDEVLVACRRAILTHREQVVAYLSGDLATIRTYSDRSLGVVNTFLVELKIVGELDDVIKLTSAAIQSLEEKGLIEDPFSKRLRSIALAVLLVFPVNFTSTTPDGYRVNAITWEYSQTQTNAGEERHLRLKVTEAVTVFKKIVVPTFIQVADAMSQPLLSTAEAQAKLSALGLYHGQVDGVFGPRTAEALLLFQKQNGLKQTGSIDEDTSAMLQKAAPAPGGGGQ